MAFWNDKITEPKRKFRWLLSVGGIPYYTIKKVNRPTYEIAEAEHKFINHTFYFPGRVTYNTISFTIVDTASPDAAETLKQMLYGAGYALPKNENVATQTITKHGGVTALGDVKIELLGGGGKTGSGGGGGIVSPQNDEGQVLEFWTLKNAWVKKIEFSELDYDGDDLAEITVEVRYDYAELNSTAATTPNGALETSPARQPDLTYGGAIGSNPNDITRQD
mgnify:CR=1 FL=1